MQRVTESAASRATRRGRLGRELGWTRGRKMQGASASQLGLRLQCDQVSGDGDLRSAVRSALADAIGVR